METAPEDAVKARLLRCFSAVFPELQEHEVYAASHDKVARWDSVATITLLTLLQEEFGDHLDFEDVENLGSFAQIYDYVTRPLPRS